MSGKDSMGSSGELRDDDVDRLLRLIDDAGYEEVQLEIGGTKIHVRKHGAGVELAAERLDTAAASAAPAPRTARQPAAQPSAAAAAGAAVQADAIPDGLLAVRAPMLGTFYGCPAPGAARFVQPGQTVGAEDTVCLIEVMKLFSSVPARVSGKLVRFLVEDGDLVEHDQPIALIDPAGAAQ